MKRAMTIMAVATAGALASAPAHAGEPSLADRIVNTIYADLGMSAKADELQTKKRSGFFVGVHQGLGAESGLAPAAAGLSIPLNSDETPDSVTANGLSAISA